jgi:hypothetical protein
MWTTLSSAATLDFSLNNNNNDADGSNNHPRLFMDLETDTRLDVLYAICQRLYDHGFVYFHDLAEEDSDAVVCYPFYHL